MSWKKPGVGRFVIFMALQSLVSFVTILCIDYRVFSKIRYGIQSLFGSKTRQNTRLGNSTISTLVQIDNQVHMGNRNTEDHDVAVEAERIKTSSDHELMETDVLILNRVEKVYNGLFHAVDQISVGVKQRECFGLLGVNGA